MATPAADRLCAFNGAVSLCQNLRERHKVNLDSSEKPFATEAASDLDWDTAETKRYIPCRNATNENSAVSSAADRAVPDWGSVLVTDCADQWTLSPSRSQAKKAAFAIDDASCTVSVDKETSIAISPHAPALVKVPQSRMGPGTVPCAQASRQREGEAGADDEVVCVICMDKLACMAIVPCGHLSMCEACCACIQACPVCRGPKDKELRILVATSPDKL
jgi:hypothetical protein